ncbi:MAG: hypothetical protein IPI76_11530 [Chloracidobacterium sp.]|nr:hypothetical protein [Chloracidobacterium sp.]
MKISIVLLTIAMAVSCSSSGSDAAVGTVNNTNSVQAASPSPSSAESTANVNTNANTVQDAGPQRIVFANANWGTANLSLAPNSAKRFVVSAKSGQTMDVEVSSKETSVNLIKGKAETTEDFGYLRAELISNGDYVFEVRNSTKKAIKASVKVTIENPAADSEEQ